MDFLALDGGLGTWEKLMTFSQITGKASTFIGFFLVVTPIRQPRPPSNLFALFHSSTDLLSCQMTRLHLFAQASLRGGR
jgi:hypothetical protein